MDASVKALAREQADMFQIFGHYRRILILWALDDAELSVGGIADKIGASLQNTSQHLRLMKDKNILSTRRDGQIIYYRVADSQTAECCKRILSVMDYV
jgi:ArsR family transcriptional regulator